MQATEGNKILYVSNAQIPRNDARSFFSDDQRSIVGIGTDVFGCDTVQVSKPTCGTSLTALPEIRNLETDGGMHVEIFVHDATLFRRLHGTGAQ